MPQGVMPQGNEGVHMTVVAVGPGDPDMTTLQGQKVLSEADLVVGFKTVLDVVQARLGHAEVRPMTYRNQEEVLDYAAGQAREGRRCVVCCWGDLNVSARELLARVRQRADHVDLVPGISSVQVACARTGISLEESIFITLHQRQNSSSESSSEIDEAVHYLTEGRRHVILFPRPWDLMPPAIAGHLLEAGIHGDQPVIIYQQLTLEGEQEWRGKLQECGALTQEFSDLSIMVFLRSDSQ